MLEERVNDVCCREDLVNACMIVNGKEECPLFSALYDFHGVGEEQLSLKKGDQVGNHLFSSVEHSESC